MTSPFGYYACVYDTIILLKIIEVSLFSHFQKFKETLTTFPTRITRDLM